MPGEVGIVTASEVNDLGTLREGLGRYLAESFDHQDGIAGQLTDTASATVDEDWTSLPPSAEAPPVVRTPEEIVATLAATSTDLERVLAGVSPEAMRQPAHDGEAAVVEIVAHLRDWDAVVGDWVGRVLADEMLPVLDVPDDSLWAIEHDYPAQDPLEVLVDFRDQRTSLVDCLSDLPANDWDCVGHLGGIGDQTVQEILDGLCRRDAEHLERIREALA